MLSLTKSEITKDELQRVCQKHFDLSIKDYSELNDGYYNISYLVKLESGSEVVLKIAPPADVDILTYEKDIMITEVLFLRQVVAETDVPVPKVIADDFTCHILKTPYFFMTKLTGKPLTHVGDITMTMRKEVYIQKAQYLAKIHSITGDCFGYLSMREKCLGKSYYEAFMVSVMALLDDGNKKLTGLPIAKERILEIFLKTKASFDKVTVPIMNHFDLWDGNIFVMENEGKLEIEGLIDFERGFYGDPAADLCQVVGYINLEEESYFLETYNQFARVPIVYDKDMQIRTYAYRLYLFMIMHIETYYRDVEGSFDGQKAWVAVEILKVFKKLEDCIGDVNVKDA